MHWRLPSLAAGPRQPCHRRSAAARSGHVGLGWGSHSDRFSAETLVTGIVYDDLDADGEHDLEEPGLGGVVVSNGVEVQSTASDGTFWIVVREDSRFVLLTVPRGYRATQGFFHRVGAEAADSAAFGLTTDPAADQAEFRFVHASDPHVFDGTTAAEFAQSLAEIAAHRAARRLRGGDRRSGQ